MAHVRRLLLGLYIAAAAGDAAAKAIAANETLNRTITQHLAPSAAASVESARRPSGNFEIFRAAARHLVLGRNLYASYPGELQDHFKYSPTFAFLFAPLAWLPWPLALFLWSTLNALVLFVAIERLLAPAAGTLVLACLFPEVLRSMQNAQSNALVAGLIMLAFLALEREHAWRAAGAAVLGGFVKIFPLAALIFAIPRRKLLLVIVASLTVTLAMMLAPLLVTAPTSLLAQYQSWGLTESADAHQRWFSVMELLHRWLGVDWPNWPIQLAGALVLLTPLALRRDRWTDASFRIVFLCSVLVYVTLFNHQAERSSYLIAFVGATIWFASGTHTTARVVLYSVTMVTIPIMSTMLPVPELLRSPTGMLYRLALPILAIWLVMQRDLAIGHARPISGGFRGGQTAGLEPDPSAIARAGGN
jgi:hypothetical protein